MIPVRFSEEEFKQLNAKGFFKKGVDHIATNAAKYPDKVAFVDSQNSLTYGQAKQMSDRLAIALLEKGLVRDDRVVIQLPNVVEYYAIRSALIKAGLIGMYTMMYLRHKEMEYACGRTEARAVIIVPQFGNFDYLEMIQGIRKNLPNLEYIFVVGKDVPQGTISINEMMIKESSVDYTDDYLEQTAIRPGEVIELKMTSGTTGQPKITESSKAGGRNVELVKRFGVLHDDVFAALAPLTGGASGGAICKGIALQMGCKIALLEKFDAEAALALMEKEKVTFATGVPTMMAKMIRHPNFDKYDLSSVRAFHSAGAYLPPALAKETEEKMGCKVVIHYGSIDIGFATSTSVNDPLEVRLSSVGRPMPSVSLQLVNDDDNQVAPGEIGEIIWASKKKGSTSYYRDIESTLQRESGGLTRTGDLGKLDDDGNLYIVGRKKDMIIRGGQNIFPAEIESILITHPKILNVAVVPMKDDVMGEKACAYVIPKAGQTITFQEIVDYMLDKKCAKYKLPERMEVTESFPMSGDGQKVMKRALIDDVNNKLKAEGIIK